MRFATIVLAAGASARMGRPKLLLPWGKKSILQHLVQQWTDLGATQIAVVVEQGSQVHVKAQGAAMEHIINPNPVRGMWSSVQAAAAWNGWQNDLTHFVITLGDQPHVLSGTLQSIINFAEQNPDSICQPSRNGGGRHPVVLPRPVFGQISGAAEPDFKAFLRARQSLRKFIESSDEGLDLDLDTPADYERALKLSIL